MVAARLHRALPRWRREASGTRFPNQGSRSGRSGRGGRPRSPRAARAAAVARPPSCLPSRPPAQWSRGRLCSCHKCQVLSPVGAPKLLLRTAGPQRRAAPRVPPDPRVPASPPPALPCPAGTTTPVPLSVLGGPATCFSGRPGGAYGNSWRELNADVGGLWSCVFCLIWGDSGGPWNPAGWATHPAWGSKCHDSGGRGLGGELGCGPRRGWKERSGVWGEKRADFSSNLLFRLQFASRPVPPSRPPPNASLITIFF